MKIKKLEAGNYRYQTQNYVCDLTKNSNSKHHPNWLSVIRDNEYNEIRVKRYWSKKQALSYIIPYIEFLEYSKGKEIVEMVTIYQDSVDYRRWVPENEIRRATYGDWGAAGYNSDEMGLVEIGENDDGETLYESDNFEGQKTFEEIEDEETDWFCLKYHDGNNYQTLIFECYSTNDVVIENLEDPSPAYYFQYNLHTEYGTFFCVQSNMSGSLSPFYDEDRELQDLYR